MVLRLLVALTFSALALLADPAAAQTAAPRAPGDLARALDQVERRLGDPRLDAAGFDRMIGEIERQREAAMAQRAAQREEAASVQSLLDALGPPPAAGQPRESRSVAEIRRQLELRLQRAQDAVKEADLALARAQALLEQAAAGARRQFTAKLFVPGRSLLHPDFWLQGAAAWRQNMAVLDFTALPGDAWTAATTAAEALLAAAAVLLLGLPFTAWLRRRHGIDPREPDPSAACRNLAALIEWLRRAFLPAAAMLAAILVLEERGWTAANGAAAILAQAGYGAILAVLVIGLAEAALVPAHPVWAPLPLPEAARNRLLARLRGFSLLAVPGAPLAAMLDTPSGGDLGLALGAFYFMAFAGAVADSRLWRAADPASRRPVLAAGAAGAIAVAVVLSVLLGYSLLAHFLACGLLLTLLIGASYALVRIGLRDAMRGTAAADSPEQRDRFGSTARFLAGLGIDLVLLIAAAALLLLAWGTTPRTLGSYGLELVYGVTIGSVTVSLLDILAAFAVLAAGVALTRFLSGGLDGRLAGQTQIDPGVRNSIVTGVSYIGYVLAALLAVGTLGLNLSNLAIIAGALSVGIGFGLQNIVNNFVSGVILLIERPVKVGDWVVVGGKEGYVRRINVRSTEIETFPRASVIIPNSELISGAVVNWTHRDKYGRVDIDIGLAYGTDVDKAEAVLRGCLTAHPEILDFPPPFVLLKSFGDSALMFAARGHIANVERRVLIESELRKAIYKACQAQGIAIPYAQTDVHLADLDRIEAMLQRLRSKPGEGA